MTPKQLAAKIATALFTDGNGQHGVRLGMIITETAETKKLSGWAEKAVASVIEDMIVSEEKNKPLSSGSAEDDAVALTQLLERTVAEIKLLQDDVSESNHTDSRWLMLLDLVVACEMQPQQALRIMDGKQKVGPDGPNRTLAEQ